MKPLTIEELRSLEVGDWVWVVLIEENKKGYAEIKSLSDDEIELHATFFWAFLDLSDYGKTWHTYKNKEQAEAEDRKSENEDMYGEIMSLRAYIDNHEEVWKINAEIDKAIVRKETAEKILTALCEPLDVWTETEDSEKSKQRKIGGLLFVKKANERIKEIAKRYGVEVDE